MNQHINAPPPAILKVCRSARSRSARLVGKMLKKGKHERHASYAELIGADRKRVGAARAAALPRRIRAGVASEPAVRRASHMRPASGSRPATAPAPRTPTKSKLPLYSAIAVAVLCLIIGGVFFLLPKKEEPLTLAQIAMAKREAEARAQAAAATSAPAAPLEPAAIKLWDTAEKNSKKGAGWSWEKEALRLDKRGAAPDTRLRDLIFRASILMNPEASGPAMVIRHLQNARGEQTWYALNVDSGRAEINLSRKIDGTAQNLRTWKLPRTYTPDEWLRLELRAVGEELTVLADGRILGTLRDGQIPGPGGLQLYAVANGYFRDIEYVPLDGVSHPPSAFAAAEPWQDALRDPTLLISGAAEATTEGLRFTGVGRAYLRQEATPPAGAVRMRAIFGGLRPELRARMDVGVGSYQLIAYKEQILTLSRLHKDPAQNLVLRDFPLREPLRAGQIYELELRVVGPWITAKLNGEILGSVQDATFATGHFAVGCNDTDRAPDTHQIPRDSRPFRAHG